MFNVNEDTVNVTVQLNVIKTAAGGLPNPPTNYTTLFVDSGTNRMSVKEDNGTTTPVEGLPASTTVTGRIRIATQAEVDGGTATSVALTPGTFANSTLLPRQGVAFSIASDTYASVNSTSYQIVTYLIYEGSTIQPEITKVQSIVSNDGDLRLYDETNLQEIATGTHTGGTIDIVTFGPISNVPTNTALLSLQGRKSGGQPLRVYFVNVNF